MKKWLRRKYLELKVKIFQTKNEVRAARLPLEDSLDDYADEQIRALLIASSLYKKAKKDPDAFVEKFFSAQIKPIKPFVDSWSKDSWGTSLNFSFLKEADERESVVSPEPEEEWFDAPEDY